MLGNTLMFCKRKYWDIRYINQQIALKTGEKNLEPSVFFLPEIYTFCNNFGKTYRTMCNKFF